VKTGAASAAGTRATTTSLAATARGPIDRSVGRGVGVVPQVHVALEHDEHLDGRVPERIEDEIAVGEPGHPRALRDSLQGGRTDRVEGRVPRQEGREIGRVHGVMLPQPPGQARGSAVTP
jgi:hypothetical protein